MNKAKPESMYNTCLDTKQVFPSYVEKPKKITHRRCFACDHGVPSASTKLVKPNEQCNHESSTKNTNFRDNQHRGTPGSGKKTKKVEYLPEAFCSNSLLEVNSKNSKTGTKNQNTPTKEKENRLPGNKQVKSSPATPKSEKSPLHSTSDSKNRILSQLRTEEELVTSPLLSKFEQSAKPCKSKPEANNNRLGNLPKVTTPIKKEKCIDNTKKNKSRLAIGEDILAEYVKYLYSDHYKKTRENFSKISEIGPCYVDVAQKILETITNLDNSIVDMTKKSVFVKYWYLILLADEMGDK